jgi:ribosomal protein L20A (L18A)
MYYYITCNIHVHLVSVIGYTILGMKNEELIQHLNRKISRDKAASKIYVQMGGKYNCLREAVRDHVDWARMSSNGGHL